MNARTRRPWSDLEVADLSHPGSVRTRNEDDLITDTDHGLFIIADGVGGLPAGDLASRLAVEEIHRFLSGLSGGENDIGTALEAALLSAHDSIRQAAAADRHRRGMGSTALIAWFLEPPRTAWLAHVGNSRAYRFRAGALEQLTQDHTLLQAVRQARMLPEDPADWPPGELLSQALGSSELIAPEVHEIDLQTGDLLLLCTDGVSDVLEGSEIRQILQEGSSLADIRERLLAEVRMKGAPDNLSAILVRVNGRENTESSHKLTVLSE